MKSEGRMTMGVYGYLIVLLAIVAFLVILPLVSGVGTFKLSSIGKKDNKKSKNDKLVNFKLNEKQGKATSGASSTFNKTLNFDLDSKTGLKKRVIGKFNTDPNSFDYDIDDLIQEDHIEEQQEQAQRFNRFNGDKEKAYNEFV